MKKHFVLLSFLFALSSTNSHAQYSGAKDGLALRYTLANHLLPVTDNWDIDNFGGGLEIEYIRHLSPALNLGIPFKMYKGYLPTDEQGNFQKEGLMSLDLLLQLKYFREPTFIYPYLFAGFGSNLEGLSDFNFSIPLGLGLNFRLHRHTYLSLKGAYRLGLEDLRDNLQLGAGLLLLLGEGEEEKKSELSDADGDGVPDDNDLCPTTAGLAALYGCPDADGDGIADGEDECPQVAGLPALKGCPDRDNDGIADAKDECPDQPGSPERNGCPLNDADGDGIADAVDACPNEAGLRSMAGCPDRDGDGVADRNDRCPDVEGTLVMAGCPDTDGDGLADADDRCPETAGPMANRGCPEIKQEDREVLNFAMQNVQFETGKAALRPASSTILDQVLDILNRYPDYKLRISGHTDSVGDAAFNQKLSESRAKSCYDYLIGKDISAFRMSYAGYGESRPIANNKFASGREQNRRVEFDIYLD